MHCLVSLVLHIILLTLKFKVKLLATLIFFIYANTLVLVSESPYVLNIHQQQKSFTNKILFKTNTFTQQNHFENVYIIISDIANICK